MADKLLAELRELFGKPIDSAEVKAFLAKYPNHKIGKPSDGRQYVTAPKHGFEMCFGLPDGSYSGGRTAHLRVLNCIWLNSDAKPKTTSFADLPLGLSFNEGYEQHVAKLGEPVSSRVLDTGAMYVARWVVEGVEVSVEYNRTDVPKVVAYTLGLPAAE